MQEIIEHIGGGGGSAHLSYYDLKSKQRKHFGLQVWREGGSKNISYLSNCSKAII
jgi:hypothetical protein